MNWTRIKPHATQRASLALSSAMLFSALACSVQADPESPQWGMPRMSNKELRENKRDLAKTSDSFLPNGVSGGVLFDGIVINQSEKDKYGQYIWQIKPDHIYLGNEELSDLVRISSPSVSYNGLVLKPGNRYRIFAVPSDLSGSKNKAELYLTWNGNVLRLPKRTRPVATEKK